MLTEHARVIAVEEDGLWVETLKLSACGACAAQKGCGQQLLHKYMSDMTCIKARFFERDVNTIWKSGDAVEIGVNENALVANALLVYLLPLVCLMAMVALTHALALPEWAVATSALAGLLFASSLIKYFYPFLLKRKLRSLDVVVLGKL
jgi:sigma-E factor negative regulatory protein RseC